MPSAILEEYLETIYKISLTGEVRPAQLAEALSVSPPTVTSTLRRLESAGLVTRPEGGVSLTESGRREALSIVRRHRIAERFLVDVLGLSWEAAHEDACRLEHAMSERVLAALESYLENPSECPHGHPIPSSDYDIAEEDGIPLSDVPPGSVATVIRVPEDDDELLAYMQKMAIQPGGSVEVEEVAPFDGPLLISVGGTRFPLDRGVATRIFVRSGG